ncbi:DUF2235 domain-containing protein [Lacibacter sp. H375]|uniref:DUF2235 domain-containing protein n=1 Tax=Lacibacter sp. H375 TaxID=3133424 RepID=UPI0030BE6C95
MIAVFMDGTRGKIHQDARRNTNVLKAFYLADTTVKKLYIEGVGAGNRVKDGMYALTTNERVMRAYRFLTENYRQGDSICLVGFSRGANQCRILSGLIYTIGLIDLRQIKEEKEKQTLLLQLYELYCSTTTAVKKQTLASHMNQWEVDHPGQSIAYDTSGKTMIDVMGLWDTVEAFAINDEFETCTPIPHHLNQVYNVKKIFHALSLDDNRAFNYTPILATHKEVELGPHQHLDSIVEEVWFNGSHKDVGGGIKNKRRDQLSGISLKWMLAAFKPYNIFRDTVFQTNIYGEVNDMRRKWHLRKTSPGDTLRAIDKYWKQMNTSWNNHRLMLHRSVIDRLDSGTIQYFKFKSRKDGSKRADWYEWEPFKNCFKKDTVNGKERIRFRTDIICPCIKIVDDKSAKNQAVENSVQTTAGLKAHMGNGEKIESFLGVAHRIGRRCKQTHAKGWYV